MRGFTTVVALLVLLGGCASTADTGNGVASVGSGGAQAPPASTTKQGGIDEQMRNFAKCMRENGVDMPDPDPDGAFGGGAGSQVDRESPAYKKAAQACQSQLPGGGDLSKLDPKLVEQLRQFTQCLRANGIDVPDPDPNSPTLGLDGMKDIDRESPVFKKAMEACKDKIPGRLGG